MNHTTTSETDRKPQGEPAPGGGETVESWRCDVCGQEADPLYAQGDKWVCEQCRSKARQPKRP